MMMRIFGLLLFLYFLFSTGADASGIFQDKQDIKPLTEATHYVFKADSDSVIQIPMIHVSGVVTSVFGGKPVPYARIQLSQDNSLLAITDENGAYALSIPKALLKRKKIDLKIIKSNYLRTDISLEMKDKQLRNVKILLVRDPDLRIVWGGFSDQGGCRRWRQWPPRFPSMF